MPVDVTNWTSLLIALTPFVIAFVRRDTMSSNTVVLLTIVVTALAYFAGRALDNALRWPLGEQTAIELAAALAANQVLYVLLHNTSGLKRLERSGNGKPE